jgi:protein SCO1/2
MQKYILFVGTTIALLSCNGNSGKKLPILGERQLVEKTVDGKKMIDTIFHKVGNFSYRDQEGKNITEKNVDGKVYVADFFFTSCPTICPTVKAQMKRVHSKYKKKENFMMLSYTIDPKRDTVGRLAWYANKLNIEPGNWHLLTGNYKSLTKTAAEYLLSAQEDPNSPGGFDHSGYIALIDRNRHIRGFYDGTDPKKVDQLIKDIAVLLNEKQ